jgi:hypothetical protein
MEEWLHSFFTSALDGSERSSTLTGRSTPRKRAPSTSLIEVGGLHNRSGNFGEQKVLLPLPEIGHKTNIILKY